MNGMEAVEGAIDLEKLKSGKYIPLRAKCNDGGTLVDNSNIRVGDAVQFNHLTMDGRSTTIGGALSMIVGIIGIANFVNSVLTSVLTRKKNLPYCEALV